MRRMEVRGDPQKFAATELVCYPTPRTAFDARIDTGLNNGTESPDYFGSASSSVLF